MQVNLSRFLPVLTGQVAALASVLAPVLMLASDLGKQRQFCLWKASADE